MPYRVEWLIPDRVIIGQYAGMISREETVAANQEILNLLEESPSPYIHLILEDTLMESFEPGVTEVCKLASYIRHPKLRWSVAAGPLSPVLELFASVMTRLAGARYRRCATLKEAIYFLAEQDEDVNRRLDYCTF